MQRLYLDVHGNATFRPFTLPNTYWAALAGLGAENVVIHVARQQQGIVGFIVSLKDGDTAFAYHIGFDRAAAQAGPVYCARHWRRRRLLRAGRRAAPGR